MARDKEAMQDIALYHMEKLNRRNQGENKVKTLAEQLEESKQSPTDRRKNMAPVEWYKDVRDIVLMNKKCRVGAGLWNWASVKYKADIEKMRMNGDTYESVLSFVKEKESDYINR